MTTQDEREKLAIEQQRALSRHHYWKWQRDLATPSFVYAIQESQGEPIKFGFATNVPERMRSLQTGNPNLLCLLALVPATRDLETIIHRLLQFQRIRGEWFVGDKAQRMVETLNRLNETMRENYDGSGQIPTHRQPGFRWPGYRSKAMAVKYVTPTPVEPSVAQQRLHDAWITRHRNATSTQP